MDLKKYIRSIQDYPKKGILFRDITTLIKNGEAFKETINQMTNILSKLDYDKIASIESLCISNVASPYSSLKSTEYLSAGNLFFFLIRTFGFDRL